MKLHIAKSLGVLLILLITALWIMLIHLSKTQQINFFPMVFLTPTGLVSAYLFFTVKPSKS